MNEVATLLGAARASLEEAQKLSLLANTQKLILIPQQDRSLPPHEIPTKDLVLRSLATAENYIAIAKTKLGEAPL